MCGTTDFEGTWTDQTFKANTTLCEGDANCAQATQQISAMDMTPKSCNLIGGKWVEKSYANPIDCAGVELKQGAHAGDEEFSTQTQWEYYFADSQEIVAAADCAAEKTPVKFCLCQESHIWGHLTGSFPSPICLSEYSSSGLAVEHADRQVQPVGERHPSVTDSRNVETGHVKARLATSEI